MYIGIYVFIYVANMRVCVWFSIFLICLYILFWLFIENCFSLQALS